MEIDSWFVLCWQARTSTCSFGNDVREVPEPHVIFCIHIFQLIFDKATISTVSRLFIQMFSKAGWKMSASPNALVCSYYHKMMAILDLKHNSFLDWKKVSRKIVSFSFTVGDCTFPPLVGATKFSTQLAINDHLKRTLHKGNWVFMSLSKRHIVCFVPQVSFEHLGSFAAIRI